MPTIVDIAREARTSPSAVSQALNNHPTAVSAETRKRILAVAKELGYRPNRRARQLRKGSNLTLGFQTSSHVLTHNRRRQIASLTLSIFQGAIQHASERGYHVQMLMPPDGRDMQEIHRVVVQENAIDGLIFIGHQDVNDQELAGLVQDLQRVKVPMVTLDQRLAAMEVPVVKVDREAGMRQAITRMVALGHRRIGFIGHTFKTVDEPRARVDFIQQTLADHGATLDEAHVISADQEVDAYRALHRLLGQPQRPTCVIFSGDHLAMAALRAVEDHQLRVPEDIAIVSMNNASYVQDASVPLCTIDFLYQDLGKTLARILIDRLERPNDPIQTVTVLMSRFIERASLGPVPTPR